MTTIHLANKMLFLTLDPRAARIRAFGAIGGPSIVPDYHNQKDRELDPFYLNDVVGPTAGRYLNDQQIILHGGVHALRYTDFSVLDLQDDAVVLGHEDKQLGITYRLTYRLDERQLHILLEATPTSPTVLNMTQHLYVNLNQEPTIDNHWVALNAPYVNLLDASCVPDNKQLAVEHTVFDLRHKRYFRDLFALDHPQFAITRHFDHPFVSGGQPLTLGADLCPYILQVHATSSHMVLYTANYFTPDVQLLSGPAQPHGALAVEPQECPNDASHQIYDKDHPFLRRITLSLYHLMQS